MSDLFKKHGRVYNEGEYLFFDGDQGNDMFVIMDGKVDIIKGSKGNEKVLATLIQGDFLGEMAILSNSTRSATAKISSPTAKILVINETTFDSMIRGNIEIAVKMLEKLSNRLFNANTSIENLLLKHSETKVVHYIKKIVEKKITGKEKEVLFEKTVGQVATATFLTEIEVKKVISKLVKIPFFEQVGSSKYMIKNINEFNDFFDYLYKKEKFTGIF